MIVATAGTTGGGMIDPLSCLLPTVARREGSLVSHRRGLGGICRIGLRSGMRGLLEGYRARRLNHHRCAQMARNHHGVRDCHLTPHGHLLSEAFPRLYQLHAIQRGGDLDPVSSTACSVVAPLHGPAAVPRAGGGRLGGPSAPMSNAKRCRDRRQFKRRLEEPWAGASANDSAPCGLWTLYRPRELGDVRALVRRVVASGRAWVAPDDCSRGQPMWYEFARPMAKRPMRRRSTSSLPRSTRPRNA